MVKVLIKKLDSKVQLPKYKTDGSSGMDLMAFLESPVNLKPTGVRTYSHWNINCNT